MSTMLKHFSRITISLCIFFATTPSHAAERLAVYTKERGIAEAKALLASRKLVLLIPSSPPVQWQYEIRFKEYAKYGIEWQLTGDVVETGFEAYREGFNGVMSDAILAKYGLDFPKKIEHVIDTKIRDAKALQVKPSGAQ